MKDRSDDSFGPFGKSPMKINEPIKIADLMREFGFRADAPENSAKALVINLVRSAYGPEAARQLIRQLNSSIESSAKPGEFEKTVVESQTSSAEPEQLSFFPKARQHG